MLLQTPTYLIFLTAVTVLYWVFPKGNWRKTFLLAASYFFYSLFDIRFALILLGLSVVVYGLGIGIAKGRHAQFLAGTGVVISLGVLGLFKYANFFLGSVQSGLLLLGIDGISPGLKLILPIGISFYTFQAISYTTEIYRKKLLPAKNFLDLALYLAFFPKLIAGPLVRPTNFFKQLGDAQSRPELGNLRSALNVVNSGSGKENLNCR